MATTAASAAKAEGLVPYDGLLSKGGFWTILSYLPPAALIAALVAGHTDYDLTWWYVLASVGGFLVLIILVFVLMFFLGEYDWQIWALQHPGNLITRIWFTLLTPIQALQSCNNEWMHARRLKYGPNFCCAGEVVLGEHAEVERSLTSPQARKHYLGQTRFIPSHCPGEDLGQRTTFLLAISDEGAGGDGDHAKFKACMGRYFFGSAEMAARRQDGVSAALIAGLAKDYSESPSKFFQSGGALETFTIKYLHYVIFGLELQGPDLDAVMTFMSGDSGNTHYIWWFGYFKNQKSSIDKVAAIYERAPALQMFEEGVAAHAKMTKSELARMMTGVIRIAGKTGSLQLLQTILGGRKMPNYAGEPTGQIDVTKVWDTLDLSSRDEVKRFTIEIARLYPPVNVVHRVALEPFTCEFKGRAVSFPTGTIVMVPMVYGNLDKGFWGPSTYELDHNRPQLSEHFLGFHSVGDRDAGRICPGRELVLEMCADVLAALGRTRRQAAGERSV